MMWMILLLYYVLKLLLIYDRLSVHLLINYTNHERFNWLEQIFLIISVMHLEIKCKQNIAHHFGL